MKKKIKIKIKIKINGKIKNVDKNSKLSNIIKNFKFFVFYLINKLLFKQAILCPLCFNSFNK